MPELSQFLLYKLQRLSFFISYSKIYGSRWLLDSDNIGVTFEMWTLYPTIDLEAHSYEVHMKPYMHNFTLNLCDLRKNLLWNSYELHMQFIWTSYEFHMKCNQFYSCEIHKKFIWTSDGLQMNFSWISYEIKSNLFVWIYMQFVWNSYEFHIEELMM